MSEEHTWPWPSWQGQAGPGDPGRLPGASCGACGQSPRIPCGRPRGACAASAVPRHASCSRRTNQIIQVHSHHHYHCL